MSTEHDTSIQEMQESGRQDIVHADGRANIFAWHHITPVLKTSKPADETDLRAYHKALRNYLLQATRFSKPPAGEYIPVLAAPFLRGQSPPSDFPVLCSSDGTTTVTLHRLLEDILDAHFDAVDREGLRIFLPPLADHMREVLAQGQHTAFEDIVRAAFRTLLEHDVPEGQGVVFNRQIKRYQGELLKCTGTVIDFSSWSVFQMLHNQVLGRRAGSANFMRSLAQCIAGLNDLLMVHRKKIDKSQIEGHLGFAERMISLDKVAEMTHSADEAGLPATTVRRVTECLEILERGHAWLKEAHGRIFTTQSIAEEFSLRAVLSGVGLEVSDGRPCSELRAYATNALTQYVGIVKALRIGTLEINQEYDDGLHTTYFAGFGLQHLTDDDLRHFPDLIIIEDSHHLLHQLEDFLALIAGHVPVRVLAVNRLGEMGLEGADGQDANLSYELAAIALAHRKAFVFQGSTADPVMLGDAIHDGLGCPAPVLWNILLSEPERESAPMDLLALHAAVESRWFPQLTYNVATGERFGSHFDILGNTQPDQMFPSWTLESEGSSGKKLAAYSWTAADFLALDPGRRASLEIVPAQFVNDDLIPVSVYLSTPQNALIGKIPFIWLVDDQDVLHAAAIPHLWLRLCRERLDYWQYIQELGGINNYHTQRALERVRAEWEAEKAAEIKDLRDHLEGTLDDVRKQEVEKAMKRVVLALLDPKKAHAPSQVNSAKPSVTSPIDEEPQEEDGPPGEQVPGEEDKEQVRQIQPDAWVESALCTSCSDCIDALPAVFKYNNDKQAVVHNPKGGTYAKIVSLAEKCPARCIHPGLPQNPDEPGIDKLIKRAEKFN